MSNINAGLMVDCPCCKAVAGKPCVSVNREVPGRAGRPLSISFAHPERSALGKHLESERRHTARRALNPLLN